MSAAAAGSLLSGTENEHLTGNAPLNVTGESARRVIAVIEAAEKSAKSGKSEPVPFEV